MSSNRDDWDEEETFCLHFESDFVPLFVLFMFTFFFFFFNEFKVDLIGSLSFSFSFPSFRPSSCLETQHPILCARSSVCSFSLRLKRTDLKRVKGRFLSGICE